MGCKALQIQDYFQLIGNGLPASLSDNQGRGKSYDRDKMGRVIKELFPNQSSNTYDYTVTGQVAKVLDSRHNPIDFKWNKFNKPACRKTAAECVNTNSFSFIDIPMVLLSRFLP